MNMTRDVSVINYDNERNNQFRFLSFFLSTLNSKSRTSCAKSYRRWSRTIPKTSIPARRSKCRLDGRSSTWTPRKVIIVAHFFVPRCCGFNSIFSPSLCFLCESIYIKKWLEIYARQTSSRLLNNKWHSFNFFLIPRRYRVSLRESSAENWCTGCGAVSLQRRGTQ